MYLKDLLASVRRRWLIVVLLLVMAGALWWGASTKVGPEYETDASVLLVPPRASEDPGANRFLGLGSLAYSVDVVARSLTSTQSAEKLAEVAPGAVFEVLPDPATSAPILVVTVTSDDAGEAIALQNAVLERIPEVLAEVQEDIDTPADRQIVASTISADEEAVANQKPRIRLLGALAVALLTLCALLLAAIDGLLLRRAARREAGGVGDEGPGDGAATRPDGPTDPVTGVPLKARLVVVRR